MRVARLAVAAALAVVTLAPRPAHAVRFTLFKENFTLGIVETMFVAYHGDMGPGLRVETDALNRPTEQRKFADLLNRLNIDLSWRRWRLFTRFDTAAYMYRPDGACGPEATTPFVLRSRYCQKPFWGEKVALEYAGRNLEFTLGDFYVSFGRGLTLSIRKLDELGLDTTLRGGKLVFRNGPFGMTLVAGFTNIQNVDQATGRYVDDPNDFIGGGRTEYRFFDKVNVGLHVVGGIQRESSGSTEPKRRDSRLMYGASIDAPALTKWLAFYAEGAGQLTTVSDRRSSGMAFYGFVTGFLGRKVTLQVEWKYYKDYQPWRASVPTAFVEFAPITFVQPPTAERILTELPAPIFSVGGIRGRVDYRINEKVQLYASTAYFEDDSVPTQPLRFHDPYGGIETRWQNGSSHLFLSGGFRYEQERANGVMHQEIGHAEWDFTQHLPRGLSIESQGFVLVRREDLVTEMTPAGRTIHPRWTEGTTYIALKWTPHLIAAAGYEWTTRPNSDATHHYFNGSLQWNITTASSLRFFVGGNRGGLRCISGICRDFPAFSGARLELVVRL